MRIKAFLAWHPPANLSDDVASVPYDVVTSSEARDLADGNDKSFLHIVRPEIDLPEGTPVESEAAYQKAADNLKRFMDRGYLVQDTTPHVFLYEQAIGDHRQAGIVACCHIRDYETNDIKQHEKTRPDKEDDRTRLVKTLRAHTGPIFLTYRESEPVEKLMDSIREQAPFLKVNAPDGVKHTVWSISGTDSQAIVETFGEIPALYIADGHHRAAAAVRVGNELDEDEAKWFLAVIFPSRQLRVLSINRCVSDLNDLTPDDLLARTGDAFDVTPHPDAEPEKGLPSMYLNGTWYRLRRKSQPADTVSALDAAALQDLLLAPILGIGNPRTDQRLSFVPGTLGTKELAKRVDSGRAAIAFALAPLPVKQMMDVADAGGIMPPKSTWFDPKLRSGLLVHSF